MQLPRKIASATGVSFTCRQCGKMIKSDYLQQGDNTVCPHCGFEQEVPVSPQQEQINLPPGAAQYVNQYMGGPGANQSGGNSGQAGYGQADHGQPGSGIPGYPGGGYGGGYGGSGLDRSGYGPGVTSELAGRGERLAAAIVDGIALLFVLYGFPLIGTGFGFTFFMLLCLAGIQIYLLTTSGQTIGKKLLNIRIVKYDDESDGGFVTNVLLRGVVNGVIGIVPFYAIVDVLFIFRDDQRCIHDLIASTKVIKA